MTTTTLSALLGGTGVWATRLLLHVRSSRVVVAPVTGKLIVMMLAPGASGGVVNSAIAATTIRLATGGGAGEIVTDVIDVTVGDSFTLTMGAPGASVTGITDIVGTGQGKDAGNTVLTGPNGYECIVVGGKGGRAAVGVAALLGGLGGSDGTGGTERVMRFAGGRGGNISDANTNARIATGGGAPNPFGLAAQIGTRGGDSSTTATAHQTGTGGGGVGGAGGDMSGANTGFAAGAGSGDSASGTTRGPNIKGLFEVSSPPDIVSLLATFGIDIYGGGAAISTENSGPGGGLSGNGSPATARQAGNMGAGGGVVGTSNSVGVISPGMGAASGGVSVNTNASAPGASAPGGYGYAVFIFLSKVA